MGETPKTALAPQDRAASQNPKSKISVSELFLLFPPARTALFASCLRISATKRLREKSGLQPVLALVVRRDKSLLPSNFIDN
jgi:hypothetical protein